MWERENLDSERRLNSYFSKLNEERKSTLNDSKNSKFRPIDLQKAAHFDPKSITKVLVSQSSSINEILPLEAEQPLPPRIKQIKNMKTPFELPNQNS